MLSYYLKCKKNAESKNLKVVKIKNWTTMLLSKCEVCDRVKNQDLSKSKKLVD